MNLKQNYSILGLIWHFTHRSFTCCSCNRNCYYQREKSVLLEKLNMVIGVFFSHVGTELLSEISKFDSKSRCINETLIINSNWKDLDFQKAKDKITERKYHLEIHGNRS